MSFQDGPVDMPLGCQTVTCIHCMLATNPTDAPHFFHLRELWYKTIDQKLPINIWELSVRPSQRIDSFYFSNKELDKVLKASVVLQP